MKMAKYKYIVMLGDGMSDLPIKELGGLTPLEAAKTPTFDFLAKRSTVGVVHTTPNEMSPGSDVANLSVMGYDPLKYHTGRSPLEAASIGVPMLSHQTTFRTNFVTLSCEDQLEDRTMVDYSADEISTEEAQELITALNDHFKTDVLSFFTGTGYRHILLMDSIEDGICLTPPHDISNQKVMGHLPSSPLIYELMEKSFGILKDHPVNQKRILEGKNPANSIWIWGQGKKTVLPSFYDKYGVRSGAISAVDLIKGIAKSADMEIFNVEGATGNYHTNFVGKAQMAIDKLNEGYDLLYVHVEAPDECGHRGEIKEKVYSIEQIDGMLNMIIENMEAKGQPYKILVTPDHATPLATLTHSRDAVPFMIFDSQNPLNHENAKYSESYANTQNLVIPVGFGHTLMDKFILG